MCINLSFQQVLFLEIGGLNYYQNVYYDKKQPFLNLRDGEGVCRLMQGAARQLQAVTLSWVSPTQLKKMGVLQLATTVFFLYFHFQDFFIPHGLQIIEVLLYNCIVKEYERS